MAAAVRVRVPASSANLGPGFDSFGLALGLYHELTVEPSTGRAAAEPAVALTLAGEGVGQLSRGAENVVVAALRAALTEGGYDGPDLVAHSRNDIPLARGLGSSAAAFLAGAAAGQMLVRHRVDLDRLLELGLSSEGHADNVAPSLYGGFTIVYRAIGGACRARRWEPPAVAAVVGVPAFELATARSRQVVPERVARADAVHALAHASLLAAALVSGRPELLAEAMADERLHEPHREPLVPGIRQVRSAALQAGALGTALSGAGPSILALARPGAGDAVGAAMVATWRALGVMAHHRVLEIDRHGLRAEKLESGA